MTRKLTLVPLSRLFAICRLDADAPVPSWASSMELVSITRTGDELSIVCPQDLVPEGVQCNRGWRCFRVAGTIEFSATGILACLAAPLADANISVFAVSTFDTDYLLVKEDRCDAAVSALRRAGHSFVIESGHPTG